MKEIALKKVNYLRSNSCKATVDENNVQFINGVALVKATVTKEDWRSGNQITYESFGLIDENFEEVYDDTLDGKTSRYLMFLEHNKSTIQIGENDYLVSVNTGDVDRSWTEFHHIRINDGIPCVMNSFSSLNTTNIPHLFTNGHALYDVKQAAFLTRKYSSIEALPVDENSEQLYLVKDIVTSYEYPDGNELMIPKNKETGIVDRLVFVIDSSDTIISPIYSELEHDWYVAQYGIDIDYTALIEERKAKLKKQEANGIKLIEGLQKKKYIKLIS